MNEIIAREFLPQVVQVLVSAENKIRSITGQYVKVKIDRHPDAQELLGDKLKAAVRAMICEVFNVSWQQITGGSRKGNIVNARHCYMYILHHHLKYSSSETGDDCLRDHSTVLAAVQKINGFYDIGDDMTQKLNHIKNRVDNVLKTLQKENKA